MHPSAAGLHTFVAHVALRLLDVVNRRKVRTRLLAHRSRPCLCSSSAADAANRSMVRSMLAGLVSWLWPPHTSLFCRSEYTSVSTWTTVLVRTSPDCATPHGVPQPAP